MYLHVRVLFTILLDLGVSRLLSGVAQIVQHPKAYKVYWVHLLWVLFLFLYLIHFWWWEYRLQAIDISTLSFHSQSGPRTTFLEERPFTREAMEEAWVPTSAEQLRQNGETKRASWFAPRTPFGLRFWACWKSRPEHTQECLCYLDLVHAAHAACARGSTAASRCSLFFLDFSDEGFGRKH